VLASLNRHRETVVASCHGMGKSFIAARAVLWFLYTHKPALVITTAPTNRQVRGILWKEIRTAHGAALVPLGSKPLTQSLTLEPNWFAIGFTTTDYDPDRFKGYHEKHILVVADEAAAITDPIFTAIDGVLTGYKPRLLMIGNPTNLDGRMARAIQGAGHDTNVINVSAFQTPNLVLSDITMEDIRSGAWEGKWSEYAPFREERYMGLCDPPWVAKMYDQWGEGTPQWSSLVLGQLPEMGDDTLIWRNWVQAAHIRHLFNEPEDAPLVAGLDVAGPGEDETVLTIRQGRNVLEQKGWVDKDARGPVARHLSLYRAKLQHVVIDVDGIGWYMARHLDDLGFKVVEFNASPPSLKDEIFVNLKAENYWGLRERFEAGHISGTSHEVLRRQLVTMKWEVDSRGRIQIESKKKMKARGLPSPDYAESLMLAYVPVKPPKKLTLY